ncbi:MAG: carboxylesterase family protein, partial [Lachnospiraceae bacterium]|nr:carboxylesterase family protein [Lachnospiraceae bacterium]
MSIQYDGSLMAKTRTGTYIGKRNEQGTIVFRGIPYGKYVGRWQELEPLTDSDEISAAYTNGPICPQVKYLNWYPKAVDEIADETSCCHLAVATSSIKGKKPVYVFIHGGANITGGYFDKRYDPQFFVNRNPDVVFVVFNYRIGILGTLYLGDLTDDPAYRYSGNITSRDQLAAFKWIQENIAAFGGDPDNITIGGRSSGSVSTT